MEAMSRLILDSGCPLQPASSMQTVGMEEDRTFREFVPIDLLRRTILFSL